MIRQAVILAAGNGSRIKRFKGDVPKPLRKVAGLPLIKRSILSAKKAGIRDFIIVVGCQSDKIIQSLERDDELGVNLQFVTNHEYEAKANGVSLLAAKPYVEGKFLLMMADHIFDPQAIEQILKTSFTHREVLLGIDQRSTMYLTWMTPPRCSFKAIAWPTSVNKYRTSMPSISASSWVRLRF
jgi:choline kinase